MLLLFFLQAATAQQPLNLTCFDNGNTNSMSFVRVNSNELVFVVDGAFKTGDDTPRSLMSQATLHRVINPWWIVWNPFWREPDTTGTPI